MRKIPRWAEAVLVVGLTIGLWELVVWAFKVKPFIVPAPSAVVKRIVVINKLPEIGGHAWQIIRQSKKLVSDHEADRIVVDDRQLFSKTRQQGGEIPAAASQHQDVRRAMQKLVHELDVAEDALAVGRRLTLPDALLEIDPRSIRGAFDDLDCTVPALIAPQQPHLTSPCIK